MDDQVISTLEDQEEGQFAVEQRSLSLFISIHSYNSCCPYSSSPSNWLSYSSSLLDTLHLLREPLLSLWPLDGCFGKV